MRKMWILGLALLSCAAWLQAQPQSGKAAGEDASETTIEGCLQQSGWQYSVIEKDGTRMPVSGYKQLGKYVGHEVEVSGKQVVKTVDTTSAGAGSSVAMRAEFKVKSVKDLGPGCGEASR